jgi:cation transport protein ChaC
MTDLWVFGYGSLMWRPGFPHTEAVPALMHGFGRSFCVYSVYHRGTPERPGLVLGLDQGGACHGMAYRVPAEHAVATIAYLREREQVTGVYREMQRTVLLEAGRGDAVDALAYVVERAHPQYAGGISLSEQAAIIRTAHGHSGANAGYLLSTVSRLRALHLRDRNLERLAALVGRMPAAAGANGSAPSASPHGHLSLRLATARNLPAVRLSRLEQQRFAFRRNLAHAASDRARRSDTRW